MKQAFVGLAYLFVLAQSAKAGSAQSSAPQVSDLSKDPRLQQTVDLHLKRALLRELTDALKKQTNEKYVLADEVKPLMVCVFAEKQPLWKVMKGVADVLGCRWVDRQTEWKLSFDPTFSSKLSKYVDAEADVLANDMYDRAMALAELAGKGGLGGASAGSSDFAQETPEDITPMKWAESLIGDRAYYVAGQMCRLTPLSVSHPGGPGDKWDAIRSLVEGFKPQAFTVGDPQNERVAASHMRSQFDPVQPQLDGVQIVLRGLPWAGTFESTDITGSREPALKPRRLVARSRPEGELAGPKYGKWLLDWETPVSEAKDKILDAQIPQIELERSPYDGGGYGIEDYLEAAARETHALVIGDAFRIPVRDPKSLKSPGSLRDWLDHLRTSEKCFIKLDGDSVEVRHGGFWDLRLYEPPEVVLREMEKIQAPDLNDYADFAWDLGTPWAFSVPYPFFDTVDVPLTRFNSKPIRDSFNALLAYGQISRELRPRFLAGETYDTLKVQVRQDLRSVPTGSVRAKNGKNVTVNTLVPVTEVSGPGKFDTYVEASAIYGVFFGGKVVGKELKLLESIWLPEEYLAFSGRALRPDYLLDNWEHASMLVSKSPPRELVEFNDPSTKTLYGSFSFLSGISSVDGVVNTIEIPEPKRR